MSKTLKLIIVECDKSENMGYNDRFCIVDKASDLLEQNKDVDNIELIRLDDDYIDYLLENNKKDNQINRMNYYTQHLENNYEELFDKGICSFAVDCALYPIVISSGDVGKGEHIFELTDKQYENIRNEFVTKLCPELVPEIYFSKYIISDHPDFEEVEDDIINEILGASDPDVIEEFKKIEIYDDTLFNFAFIYVIAKYKVPRILNRENVDKFINPGNCITNFEINMDKIYEILNEDTITPILYPLVNCLIYLEEFDNVIEGWLDVLSEKFTQEMDNIKKMEEMQALHTKNKKNNKNRKK